MTTEAASVFASVIKDHLELKAKKLHYAIGQVPATSEPFQTFDFNAAVPR